MTERRNNFTQLHHCPSEMRCKSPQLCLEISPLWGATITWGKLVMILAKIKNHIKMLLNQASIRWVIPPQIWTRRLLSDQEWSQGILSSESEGAKWQTFEEAGKALLEHDHRVRSLLLNTVTQWLNVLPAFITNEIHVGSASRNDATTSQEPDRHTSPASSGSDIPQVWVSNLKDQRPRSNTAKPKSDLWQSYNIGLPPVGQ